MLTLIIVSIIFSQTEEPDTLVIEKPDTVGVGGADCLLIHIYSTRLKQT
jgi:hypothetical protein